MLHAGARLGDRYVLLEPVARGGMGEVWRAEDPVLGRIVAVKLLHHGLSGDPGFAERFRSEARAMAALSDPNIVEVYDYGEAQGLPYLVMQFVTGEPLHHLLRRVGPLPPHQAMTLVAQAARALHQAHVQGIVHRDVKPGNLLVRPDGRLVLTDFGIAQMRAAERLTAVGEIVGTPSYLAPEQVLGHPVGPPADVYALGIVAYECLTLTPPFVAETPMAVALMRTQEDAPPLPASVPPRVRLVVMRALARDPRQRWASAGEMAAAASAAAGVGHGVGHLAPALHRPSPMVEPSLSSRISLGELPTPRLAEPHRAAARQEVTSHGRRPRRHAVAWAAAIVVASLMLMWIVVRGGFDRGAEASPPPGTPTGSSPQLAAIGPTTPATQGPSLTPTPGPTTQPTAATPTKPKTSTTSAVPTTTSHSPGPNDRVVPDVTNKYEIEADYAIRAAGLTPVFRYLNSPTQCWAIDQTQKAGSTPRSTPR